MNKSIVCAILLTLFSCGANAKVSSMQCKDKALKEASKLLAYYSEEDDRAIIDDKVTPLAQIKNPQNNKQIFDVLETWGYIFKGKYRIRIIYASNLDCALMGEEILEYADL